MTKSTRRTDTSPLELKEEIIRYILTKILRRSGIYKPGEFLSEAGVAEEVTTHLKRKEPISRVPVREAFLELASEGFLRSYPRQGTQIRILDDADAIDLWKARQFLEERTAVELVRQEKVPLTEAESLNKKLEEIATEAVRNPKVSDDLRAEFVRIDSEMHPKPPNTPNTAEFAKTLQRIRRLILLANPMPDVYPTEMQNVVNEHKAIFRAIRPGEGLGGDPEEAKKRVRAHLVNSAGRWNLAPQIKTSLPGLFNPAPLQPDIAQMIAVRSYIETRVALDLALGHGALGPAQEIAAAMNDILRSAKAEGTEVDLATFKSAFKSRDLHFHMALIDASRYGYLREPLGYIWHQMFNDERFPPTNLDPIGHMEAVVGEHRKILTAIGLAQLTDDPAEKRELVSKVQKPVLDHIKAAFLRWQKYYPDHPELKDREVDDDPIKVLVVKPKST